VALRGLTDNYRTAVCTYLSAWEVHKTRRRLVLISGKIPGLVSQK